MSRFPYQHDEYVGTLNKNPVQITYPLIKKQFENDIFKFDITGTSNINLSLNNISVGDDADLYLYRDSNRNGILDNGDILVQSSKRRGDVDETINVGKQSKGIYFARVAYFNGGSDNIVDYDLDLSAQDIGPSNVIGVDVNLGNLNGDVTRHGLLDSSNTVNTYEFNLDFFEVVNIKLFGLSADADIRLIQDSNNDGVVQANEVVAYSTNKGSSNESIFLGIDALLGIDLSGTYQLQVYQHSGNTNYTVNFDHFLL